MPKTRTRKDEEVGSRDRLIAATDRLLRQHGYTGTSLADIATEGKAPMGSIYFHFPGGKEQLAVEALKHGAAEVAEGMRLALAAGRNPVQALANCATRWADIMEASDWKGGCPVAATALQMCSTSDPIRSACAEIFQSWINLLSDYLLGVGYSKGDANRLAETTISLLEGGELLARVQRHRGPLDRMADAITAQAKQFPRRS